MNAPSVKTSTASQLCPNPDIICRIAGKTRIPNLPSEPQFLKRNEHFCQVYPVFTPEANSDNAALAKPPTRSSTPLVAVKHSSTVRLYPTNLLPATSKPSSLPSLTSTIRAWPKYQWLQRCSWSVRGESGHGAGGTPQRKGLLPQYPRNQLLELQHKFDELEAVGVFRRRKDVNIIVEYLNLSFLVK